MICTFAQLLISRSRRLCFFYDHLHLRSGSGARSAHADDPNALDDPPEVREIMEELGEDPRGRGSGAAGALGGVLPRGPLSVVSTLATGVVALGTQALVWAGDAGDRLLFNTPLGASPVRG